MSEWIDLIVYASQAIALWVLMPRWGARMALPMMRARNAAWVDAHPDALATVAPGVWFLPACYGWAALTVLVLLGTRLGLLPQDLLPHAAGASGWKILMSANNLMLSLGMIGYLGGAVVFQLWLRGTVPPSQLRQASLQPRVIDNYVPRWLRTLVLVAVGAHLAAWLYVGATHRFEHPGFWPVFAGVLLLTAVMFVMSRYSVVRRTGQFDGIRRDFRRSEVRLMYAVQLVLVGLGVIGLCKVLYNIDLQRLGTLAFAVFVAVSMLNLTRPPSGRATGHAAVN